MRKLIVNTFLTLDGVMQAPGGPEEDREGGFAHGGWSVNYWDDGMGRVMDEIMGKPFDLVLGRKTYEIFASYWPRVSHDPAKALNDATKNVASRTLTSVEWQNSRLIEGDAVEAVRKLKDEDGPELQVHGSANLLQTLIPSGLIDEYHVWTFPVVVGPGKRLFDRGTMPAALELVESVTSTTGVVAATYVPAGELVTGSFALEEPSEAETAGKES
ncbi:MAG TPA: dihydrofolate reductase family protein [Actinomycetota bacterium]|nr:dihydrofolate reductase family protein [Actinomycetota bacterium]